MTKYEEIFNKDYEDLTPEEKEYMIDTEIMYYRDRVEQLRKTNVPDYKIAAYIHDLWQDYIIFDDVRIADACEISDDDWSKGLDYYWHDMMEDNPLRD